VKENGQPFGSEFEWTLTAESSARFLARLDQDRERAGEKYETRSLTLVKFSGWLRACFP